MPIPSDRAARLLQTGMALSSELSLPALLQHIVESAAEMTGARYAALGVLGDHGHELVDFLTSGVDEAERAAIGDLPHGRGILGALIDDATVLRLPDIRKDPRSAGFPPHHPPMHSFLGAPIRALGRVFGNLYLTEKRGADEFTEEDEEVLTVLAAQAGVAVANARLYEETRRREKLLEATHQITTATLAGAESDAVLRLVCERARELVSASLASLVAPDEDDPSLSVRVSVGERADQILGLRIPTEGSVSGDVIRTGRPVVLDDAAGDARTFQPMVGAAGMGPAVFVPLAVRGAAFGSLAVARDHGRPRFGTEDVRILEGFAAQAAIAVEFARAQRELHRLALVDERERIAKELHDGVIQALFAVGLGLQGAAALVGEPRLAARIQEAVNELDRVIGDLRNYIFGLRPGVLAGGRIGEALHQLAHEFESRTGVVTVVDLDVTLEAALAPHAVHIVQLTREALSNVGRHAGAATCRVSLHRENGRAVLEVDDDGRGFEVLAVRRDGMGMSNLRNRAESMGGDFSVQSVPDEGTTVRVAIPV